MSTDEVVKIDEKGNLTIEMLIAARSELKFQETMNTIREIAADYVRRINDRG